MTAERWLPIPDHPDYLVSDLGRVMSLKWGKRRILRTSPDKDGYQKFHMYDGGVESRGKVHTLVALLFHGPRPKGLQIRHINGDPSDNQAANLAYGTPSENALDSIAHGQHHWARKTHCPAGHEYTPENTAVRSGRRHCRACKRARRQRPREPAA